MTREATTCDLKELVQKFVPEAIGREIEKASRSIYPLQNVYVRKAKILKAPKFDVSKLLELHGESTDVSLCVLSCVTNAHVFCQFRRLAHGWPRSSRSLRFLSLYRRRHSSPLICTARLSCTTFNYATSFMGSPKYYKPKNIIYTLRAF